MTRRFLGMAALFLASSLCALPAQSVSVDGEWELVAGTQKGDVTWKVVFVQTGEDLVATMTGPRGNEVKGKGTIKRDAIEWSIRVSTQRGDIDVVYKGVVTGDEMAGEVNRGNLGTAKWSAKRNTPPS